MEDISPYKLIITIENGRDLPIGDIISSDPYVVVLLSGKEIGRTTTIYANHRTPEWHQTFFEGLFHVNHQILLEVYDEDKGKRDDLLGTVTIDLKKIPVKSEQQKLTFDLVNAGKFKSKGKISVTILLTRKEGMIKVVTDKTISMKRQRISQEFQEHHQHHGHHHHPHPPSVATNGKPSGLTIVTSASKMFTAPAYTAEGEDSFDDEEGTGCFDTIVLLQDDNYWSEAHDLVKTTFTDLASDRLASSLNIHLLKDLLYDVLSVKVPSNVAISKYAQPSFKRFKQRFVGSSKIVFPHALPGNSGGNTNGGRASFFRFSPIEENSIQINLSLDDTKFILIGFPNRYLMWTWCKWLQLAYDCWHGHTKMTDLPDWAQGNQLVSFHCDVTLYSGEQSHGKIALHLERPHMLIVGTKGDSLVLLEMSSIIVATDSIVPKTYTLEVEFVMDKMILDKSSGVPLPSSFKGAPKNNLLMAWCRDESFRMNKNDTNTKCFIDFSVDELEIKSQSFASSGPGSLGRGLAGTTSAYTMASAGNNGSSGTTILLPDPVLSKLHFDLYLLQGQEKNEKVTAQAKCFIDTLLKPDPKKTSSGFMNFTNKSNQLTTLDSKLEQEIYKEVSFDKTISISITIESAQNLMVPEAALKGLSSLFGKCKLVGPDGISSSVKAYNGESRTSNVTVSAAGRQGPISFGTQFIFKADQLANNKHGFFRVEFVIGNGFGSNTSIGAAFVPIDYCTSQRPKVYPFPVLRFRASNIVYPLAAKDGKGYGQVLVKVARIEETLDDSNNNAVAKKIGIRSTLHECSVYNTQWFAQCLPLGGKDMECVHVERAVVKVDFDGLQLSDIVSEDPTASDHHHHYAHAASSPGNPTQVNAVSVANPLKFDPKSVLAKPSFYETSSQHHIEAVIEIFENQRRNPFPPFEWNSNALTRASYSNSDFSIDYKFKSKSQCQLPEGLEWIDNDWKIDKAHIKTDDNGWIYGFTFGKIVTNYQQNLSYTSSANAHARRRKLIRRVRVAPTSLLGLEASAVAAARSLQRLFDHCNAINTISLDSIAASDGPRASLSDASSAANIKDWREELFNLHPEAVLMTCQERETVKSSTAVSGLRGGSIIIPWKQINNLAVITPSILSLTFSVNRYLPQSVGTGSGSSRRSTKQFHPAEVEVFVSNCHAHALKTFLEERFVFARIREDFRLVEASGRVLNTKPLLLDEDGTQVIGDDDGISAPDTQELSLGSEMMASLDDQGIALQSEVNELIKKYDQSSSQEIYKQLLVYYQRLVRVRLYMASLIGLEITDWHGFNTKNIETMLNFDFIQCRKIVLENDVVTANNRIEYLLDVAEKRIRDAAIAGWRYQGKGFEQYIEMFANDYFVEITGLLAAFFEEKGQSNVKGLTNKITLLNTFMKHNDRLQTIIESALRPYGLTTEPMAKLSSFLDIKVLVQWYKEVLQLEMRQRLVQVLDVWKDKEKDVTGLASLYKFSIPWVPLRLGANQNTGAFISNIPEDVVEYLMTYLLHARMNHDDISPSFHPFLGELDTKVFSSYANVFIFLAESYQQALNYGKQWSNIQDPEELEEYITWLCSVANDASRVIDNELMIPQKLLTTSATAKAMGIDVSNMTTAEAMSALPQEIFQQIELSRQAFEQVQVMAIDQLSCILCLIAFHDKQMLLQRFHLLDALKLFYTENGDQTVSSYKFMDSLVDDMKGLLYGHAKEFLVTENYQLCKEMIVNKVMVMFLSLIAQSKLSGDVYPFSTSISLTSSGAGSGGSSMTATSSTASSLNSSSTTSVFFLQLKEEGLVMKDRLEELLDEGQEEYQLEELEKKRSRSKSNVGTSGGRSPTRRIERDRNEGKPIPSLIPLAQTRLCLWLLDPILNLMTHAITDVELQQFIATIKDLVMESRVLANGVADCLEVCLSLKGVRLYENSKQKLKASSMMDPHSHGAMGIAVGDHHNHIASVGNNDSHSAAATASTSHFPVFNAFRRATMPSAPPSAAHPPPAPTQPQGRRGSLTEFFSHIPKGPIRMAISAVKEHGHHGDSSTHHNTTEPTEEVDAEDTAMALALEEQKMTALEACIDELIRGLRHAGSPVPYKSTLSTTSITSSTGSTKQRPSSWKLVDELSNKKIDDMMVSINVFERLFSIPFSSYTLLGQLCHTALPSTMRDCFKDDDQLLHTCDSSAGSHASVSSAFSALLSSHHKDANNSNAACKGIQSSNVQEWFHHQGQHVVKSDAMKKFAAVVEKGSSAILGEEISAQLLNQLLSTQSGDELDGGINHVSDPKVSIVIYDVKLTNLFYLHWFKAPKVYMIYRVNHVACRTVAKDGESSSVNWSNDAPKILKIEHVTSSQMELEFDVLYEGMLGDTLVTSARIPFNPYDPTSFTDKEIEFTEFSIDANQGAQKAKSEGRAMPKMTASVRIISNLL